MSGSGVRTIHRRHSVRRRRVHERLRRACFPGLDGEGASPGVRCRRVPMRGAGLVVGAAAAAAAPVDVEVLWSGLKVGVWVEG